MLNVLELPLCFLKEIVVDAFGGAKTKHLVSKDFGDACVVIDIGRVETIVKKLVCYITKEGVARGTCLIEFL